MEILDGHFEGLSPATAHYLAERIYADVVAIAVEEEREDWIIMSKCAPDRPDGRGFDS